MSDPWAWGGVALVAACVVVYLLGATSEDRSESARFLAGMLVLGVALSPAGSIGARHGLELHMAQHVAIVVGAAPLIVLGHPRAALARALPVWMGAPLERGARRLGATLGPIGICLVSAQHAVVFWLWHAPVLYDAAVRHDSLHALEHAMFLASALLFWWTIVNAELDGERGLVLAMIASVATVIQGSALGLLMLVAHSPWYTAYPLGDDPVGPQQSAAALMWGTTGSAYMLATAVLLWRLLAEVDRRTLDS
jgi:putative membrane protein